MICLYFFRFPTATSFFGGEGVGYSSGVVVFAVGFEFVWFGLGGFLCGCFCLVGFCVLS